MSMNYKDCLKYKNQINKFNIHWQVLRSKLHSVDIENRINILNDFLAKYQTFDMSIRVINYLYSIYIVNKNEHILNAINNVVIYKNKEKENNIEKEIDVYTNNELIVLYNDLYKRNKKWLLNGYFHFDQNKMMDIILNKLNKQDDELIKLRIICNKTKNVHKFLF